MKDIVKSLIKLVIKTTIPPDIRKRGRRHKEPIDHYIEVIDYVLRTGIQWNQLHEKLHFTTYHKKFILWSRRKVFQNTYTILLKLLKAQKYLTDSDLLNLYIDSSMIKNIRGHNNFGPNHYDRGRKGNKVTVIVTNKGIPLAINFDKSNTADINLVEPTLDNIHFKILGSRLIADKGYVSKKHKHKLRTTKQIYLVYPSKSNQKRNLPEIQKKLLSKRNIVENFFAWIQSYRRIRVRYETSLANYSQFYYLALVNLIANKVDL